MALLYSSKDNKICVKISESEQQFCHKLTRSAIRWPLSKITAVLDAGLYSLKQVYAGDGLRLLHCMI